MNILEIILLVVLIVFFSVIIIYWSVVKKLVFFILIGIVFGFLTVIIMSLWFTSISPLWILVCAIIFIAIGMWKIKREEGLGVLVNN